MEKMEEMQAAELARHRVDQGAGGYYAKIMDKDQIIARREQPLLMRMRPGHSGSITRRPVSGITGMIFQMGQASLSRRITPCSMTGKLMLP